MRMSEAQQDRKIQEFLERKLRQHHMETSSTAKDTAAIIRSPL